MFERIIKNLFSESAIYALGPTLTTAVGFVLIPMYTSYLTPGDYGKLEFVIAISVFLGPVISGGLVSAFWKYGTAPSECEKSLVLFNCLISQLTICAVLILAANVLLWISPASEILQLLSLYTIVLIARVIQRIVYLEFQSSHKSFMYVALSVITALLIAAANVVMVAFLHQGVRGIIMGNMMGTLLGCVLFLPCYWKAFKVSVDFGLLKKLYEFGAPLAFANMSFLVLSTSDRFFISKFAGTDDLGLYGYGFRFASLLSTFVIAPFFLGFNPMRWEVYARDDAQNIFARLYSLILVGMVSAYFLVVAAGVVLGTFMTSNPEFSEGLRATPLIAFSMLLQGLYYFRSMGLLFEKRTSTIFVIVLASSCCSLLLNLLLVPLFGYMGAAAVSVFAYFVMFLMCSWQSQKHYPITVDVHLERAGLTLACALCVLTWVSCDVVAVWQIGVMALGLGALFLAVALWRCRQPVQSFVDICVARLRKA